ncbi:LINE-1 reverse transcriptase [Aphis craccivora]|uniref:LINE-1 reverse transcriptase n=1 Tax=Aphis craccivora TaxID=307492 RepID=A0A6G0W5J7_APHCR|nr:LINE-1 reverse transcriptase [Aphis craccivora]
MIPNIFFSNCKFVLTIPLLYLYNLSLSTGIFPTVWKTSFITPIYKGGDISSITNYRQISLISIIPKIFESIISKKNYSFAISINM